MKGAKVQNLSQLEEGNSGLSVRRSQDRGTAGWLVGMVSQLGSRKDQPRDGGLEGENLGSKWAHQGEGGTYLMGEIRVRATSGADGGVDR